MNKQMNERKDRSFFIIKNKRNLFYIIRDFFITLLLWGLWLYLIYPIIAILVWKFFDKNIYYHKSGAEIDSITQTLMHFFLYNGIIIPILGAAFVLWGIYNRKNFGANNRRKKKGTPVSPAKLASAYDVDPSYIQTCQNTRYLRIYHVDKSPKEGEFPFPPLNPKLQATSGKAVSIYFNNNWDAIRKKSMFGTIKRQMHIPLQERRKSPRE